MNAHHEDDQMRRLLAPLDDVEPASRRLRRRPRRRLSGGVALGALLAIVAATGTAAALGAFSGGTTPASKLTACEPATTALTTESGGKVLVGYTDAGITCLAYKDANGVRVGTAGQFDATGAGDVVALRALDTSTNSNVIAGVVPAGYDTLSVGAVTVPIVNHAFVIDPKLARNSAEITGPAGKESIDLSALAGP